MKHWIEFLIKNNKETKEIGQVLQSTKTEIAVKKNELKELENFESSLNDKIVERLLPFYSCPEHLINEVVKAQKKAD